MIEDGAAVSRSPWWIDYNHAPPGAGYLHILFALHTHHPPGFPRQYVELGGTNRFVSGGYPRDFTHARVSARLRGEVQLRGAQCLLLVQSKTAGRWVNLVLSAQPFRIESEWSWQTAELAPDPAQWLALGSRHDRRDTYGNAPVAEVLADVNGDIILVLFPLDVRPAQPLSRGPHRLRAGEDYRVAMEHLPCGYIQMDEFRIEFPA